MSDWKKTFVEKLGQARSRWTQQLDQTLDEVVRPVFNELDDFLRDNGIKGSAPLNESGRRSFKFEVAEDAYLLMVFRVRAPGEFELSREIFVLGAEARGQRTMQRVTGLTPEWVQAQMQAGLDEFVDALLNAEQLAAAEAFA